MKFPDQPRVIYDQNPLVEVVCQLTFNRLLLLDERVPAVFQSNLGRNYPKTSTRDAFEFKITVGDENVSRPSMRTMYDFGTKDGFTKITICSEFIAVITSRYEKWENYLHNISVALSALTSSYDVPEFTRIGLRYVNVIDRDKLGLTSSWNELAPRNSSGLFAQGGINENEMIEYNSAIVFNMGVGKAALRQGLSVKDSVLDGKFLIDCDFFVDEPVEGTENALSILNDFNRTARNAFRWLISDQLHNALGPKSVD